MRRLTCCCVLLIGCFILTGCSSLRTPTLGNSADGEFIMSDPGSLMDPSETEKSYNAVRQARARNAVVLHVLGDSDPIRVLPLPGEGQSVLLSDLLRQSGVSEKLCGIDATLFRQVGSLPSGQRMTVKMENGGKSVRPETDYALHPGDKIQVRRKSASDPFQTMFSAVLSN